MSDWRQRLADAGSPAVRLERELRYRFVAPLVRDAAVWCDVGGDLAAAAAALSADDLPARVVLAGVTQDAADDLPARGTEVLDVDLSDASDLERLHEAITSDEEGDLVVTCLTALDSLDTFAPLVDLLVELADKHAATVVLAAPAAAPPEPQGAAEELRRLLPADHVIAHQAPLVGSAIAPLSSDSGPALGGTAPVGGDAPTHVLAAFGPGAAKLGAVAVVAPGQAGAQRARERALETDAALVPALQAELEALRARA